MVTLDLDDYNESTVTKTTASSTTDLDISKSNVFEVEAVGNITITFSNVSTDPAGNSVLIYFEDSDGGGAYTISWPSSVVWSNGIVIDTIDANSNIEVALYTTDGGTEWRAAKSAEAYS